MKLIRLEEDVKTDVVCDFSVWTLAVTGRFRWLFVVVHCTLLYLQFNYAFPLEESMSRVVNQNSLTPHLGQQNLTNSPGKQQLELSTRTWSGRAPWNRGKFVSQMALSKRFLRNFFYFWVWLRLGEHWGSRGNKIHCWNQSRSSKWRFYMWSLFFPTCTGNLRIHDKRGLFLTLLIRKPLWNNKCYMFT